MSDCGCQELENHEGSEPCEGVSIKDLPTIDVINLNDWLVIHDTSENKTKKTSVAKLLEALNNEITIIGPTYVMYTNLTTITIPYTNLLKAKYGTVPTVTIYDINNNIVALGSIVFDDVQNPTTITVSTEEQENLIIKIS